MQGQVCRGVWGYERTFQRFRMVARQVSKKANPSSTKIWFWQTLEEAYVRTTPLNCQKTAGASALRSSWLGILSSLKWHAFNHLAPQTLESGSWPNVPVIRDEAVLRMPDLT